jgi:ABC-type phosphate/phosphonate transport system permease subunit
MTTNDLWQTIFTAMLSSAISTVLTIRLSAWLDRRDSQ